MPACACFDRLRPAVEQISRGLEDLKGEQGHPFGRLRLYVTHLAGAAIIAPVWARFLSTFPDVQLEIHTAEAPVDIVEKGFDAGIGPKDWAAADMIAVRVMGPMRVAVVGAPTYFARRRPPRTPDDLASIAAFNIAGRRDPCSSGHSSEWQIAAGRAGRPGNGQRPDLAVRAAVDGLGIAYTIEALADPFLRTGQLVRVLQDWSPFSRGSLSLLSRPPAGAGRATRPDRHAPRHPAVGPAKGLIEVPFAAE